MSLKFSPQLWQLFHQLSDRIVYDVELLQIRFELPSDVVKELRERLLDSLRREMGRFENWHQRDLMEWSDTQLNAIKDIAKKQNRINDELLGMERRLDERLFSIEERLADAQGICRYDQDNSLARNSSFVTMRRNTSDGKVSPDPESFLDKLVEISRSARVLVLADPYALSDSNDHGVRVDCVEQIAEICVSSIEHLHLYARRDSARAVVWENLRKKVGQKKLTVYFGDLHDRYLLAGSDFKKKAFQFNDVWHGCEYWRGVVFGASLNGVKKRPTYILPFNNEDLPEIRAYLDEHAEKVDFSSAAELGE